MSEQVLDVKGSVRLLRRFWWTVAVFVLAGVAAGAAFVVETPNVYKARAMVLLPSSGGSASTAQAILSNAVTADAGIATSAAVLRPAGRRAGLSLPLSQLERQVSASRDTNGLLQITASAASPRKAEELANAVAGRLVAFVTTGAASASSRALSSLQSESTHIANQLADVQNALAAAEGRLTAESPTSPGGKQDSALVATLTTEQASLADELNSVKGQIAQAQFSQISMNQGTQVIQRAATASGRSPTSYVLYPVLGAVAGLLLGSIVVLAWRRRDSRLWTKDALSQAIGAPIALALEVTVRRSTREWKGLLGTYRPSASEKWKVRRALRELGVGDRTGTRLVVLAFADDAGGLSQAVEVAVVAASSGVDTAVSVVATDEHAAALRAACAAIEARPDPVRPCLSVGAGQDPGGQGGAAELTVTVFVVERRQPGLAAIDRRGAVTVISVSSGAVSAEHLARLAIAAADTGDPVQALFVANPLPDDVTVGRVPDAAWTVASLPGNDEGRAPAGRRQRSGGEAAVDGIHRRPATRRDERKARSDA